MNYTQSRYTENFPEEFSIRHKITENTEKKNFHLHKQLEIVFALSGNLKCKFENGITDIPQNGMILLNPMNLHYIFPEKNSGICDRFVLYFSSNYISYLSPPEVNLLECFLLNRGGQPVVLSVPDDQLQGFLTLLHGMEEYQEMSGPSASGSVTNDSVSSGSVTSAPAPYSPETYGKELHTKFLLGRFLLLTNQLYFQKYGTRNSVAFQYHSQQVSDICEYIRQNYETQLSTDDIAKHFHISKTQLYYIFKEVSGITVSEYITEYRITKAKDFLINTSRSVELISQEAGYMNISSFSRVFKLKAGCSPLQYRKKHTAAAD